jgi:hypothetical protein
MPNLSQFIPADVTAVLSIYLTDEPRPPGVASEEWLSSRLARGLCDHPDAEADLFLIEEISETLSRCNRDLVRYLCIRHTDRAIESPLRKFWHSFGTMRSALQGPESPVVGVASKTEFFARVVAAVTLCFDDETKGRARLTGAERTRLGEKVRTLSTELQAVLRDLGYDENVHRPVTAIREMTGATTAVIEHAEHASLREIFLRSFPGSGTSVQDVLAHLQEFPVHKQHPEDVLRVNQEDAMTNVLASSIGGALVGVTDEDRVDITLRLIESLAAGAIDQKPINGKASSALGNSSISDLRLAARIPALTLPTRAGVARRIRPIEKASDWDFADVRGDFRKAGR